MAVSLRQRSALRLFWTSALLGVPWTSTAAWAQDGEPIIVGEHEKLKYFALDRMDVAFEAYWRSQTDETDPMIGPSTRDTETLARESLILSAEGYMGHPNLVLLNLEARIQLSQEDIDAETTGLNQSSNENINEYDVSALILRRGKLPVTVYSRRSQTLLTRQFGSSLDNIQTEHGIRLAIQSEIAPSQLQYFHREQEQTGRFSGTDFLLTEDNFSWHGRLRPVNGHRMTWDYTLSSVDQSGPLQAPNNFQRHDAFLTHTYDFGEDAKNQIRSSLRYFKETGNFPIERFRWEESLRMEHSRTFETRYDFLYDDQQRRLSNQQLMRGSARFRHQLFDSLVTSGQIGASQLDIPTNNFDSTQVFGDLTAEYTKIVPHGLLLATANTNFITQDDSSRGSTVHIDREPHSFGTSGLITLNRRNIAASSIVITDATGLILYHEGVDFTIRDFVENIEIRRILGGAIGPGDSVLISYDVGPEPASTTDTLGYGITLRYRIKEGRLKGLSPYMRYRDQSQSRSGRGVGNLPTSDFQDLVVGVDYDFWRMSLTAEHQIHDSQISPFDRTRLEARYLQRLSRVDSLIISAYYQDTDRTDENAQTTIMNVTGRWKKKLTERLRGDLVGTWRTERDNRSGDTDAFDINLDLNWRYRQTLVYVSVRNSIVNSDTRDNTSQTLLVGFRRSF